MKFSRLVAYGCSHTAGAETQDNDFIPDADLIKKEIGMSNFMIKYHEILSQDIIKYANAGKEKSYIKHLADRLNIPYDNRAEPGSGLAEQIFRLETDLSNNLINETDLIIIGITGKDRVLYFEDDVPRTILIAYKNTYPDFIKDQNTFLNYFNDQVITFQNLMFYQYLLNTANKKLKNQLYFAFCDSWAMNLNYSWPGMIELPDFFKNSMTRLQNEFVNSKYLISKTNLYHNTTIDELHPGNHVKEIVHIRFADELYKKLKKKIKVS